MDDEFGGAGMRHTGPRAAPGSYSPPRGVMDGIRKDAAAARARANGEAPATARKTGGAWSNGACAARCEATRVWAGAQHEALACSCHTVSYACSQRS